MCSQFSHFTGFDIKSLAVGSTFLSAKKTFSDLYHSIFEHNLKNKQLILCKCNFTTSNFPQFRAQSVYLRLIESLHVHKLWYCRKKQFKERQIYFSRNLTVLYFSLFLVPFLLTMVHIAMLIQLKKFYCKIQLLLNQIRQHAYSIRIVVYLGMD